VDLCAHASDAGLRVLRCIRCDTFASRVVQAGLSLVEIQNLLGHASPITSLRYAHLAPNQAASKALMVLDKFNGTLVSLGSEVG
jgi:site-specific recombinase XerD